MDQISDIMRLYEDMDSIVVANRDGVLEYGRIKGDMYLPKSEAMGLSILELYPGMDEADSTIMQVLKTGEPIYRRRQELVNMKGQRVLAESTTLPIVINGEIQGVVDASKYYVIGQHTIRSGAAGGVSTLERIVTRDPAMERLKDRVRDVAGLNASVLILGETGTGKELVAEALHSEGGRADGPFVAQNCAAIPANLLESIFFGTDRGSYTGAVDRKGLFEVADGGTLFLDEINSMDIGLQAKLLKAIEDKKVRHVGGHRDIPFDVRIVAAMNEDPGQALDNGHLRQDLYYRLGVIRMTLPPLRERPGDIPLLTEFFLDKSAREMGREVRGVSPLVEELFRQYGWPGNIRELQNTIEGAVATARSDTLRIEDVQDLLRERPPRPGAEALDADLPPSGFSLAAAVEDYERGLILRVLREASSISDASRRLGLSRQNLKYKLKKYDLENFLPL